MSEGGGPKRRMQIDFAQLAREREKEEEEQGMTSKTKHSI